MHLFRHSHEPTDPQIAAGNYRKKHIRFAGMDISIENPAGTVRRGVDPDGNRWESRMHFDYGYIRRTLGTDGDHVDCFIGPDENAALAYVITTRRPPEFTEDDEQKVMLGFDNAEEAIGVFMLHYDDERFLGDVLVMPVDDFKVRVAAADGALIVGDEMLFKALGPGERWITVHNGSGEGKGTPLLIQEHPDGTASVIGGAGGAMNHLKLRGVKPQSSYRQELSEKHKERQLERKEQIAKDKESGVYEAKQAERGKLKAAMQSERDNFVHGVAELAGWEPKDLEFDEAAHAGLSPGALETARKEHKAALFKRAKDTVELNRRVLVEDAGARAASGLGLVPLQTNDADTLSVNDLAPLPEVTGAKLGFSPDYAERSGLDAESAKSEANAALGKPETPDNKPIPESKDDHKKAIAEELAAFRKENPDTPPPNAKVLTDAQKAASMLKLQKRMKLAEQQAREASKALDTANVVESKAQIIDVSDADIEESARKQMEEDVRTSGTRAFLRAAEAAGGESKLAGHVGAGAFNALNSFSQIVGGDGLIDRSVVDVLGVAGAAQVLARRVRKDMGDAADKVRDAMGEFHVEQYEKKQNEAVAQAKEFYDAASAIELPDAENGADLLIAQAANDKRRQAVAEGQRVLGQAMGEMQGNAALVSALQGSSDHLEVNLGMVKPEQAVIQLRAIGLQPGDFELAAVGGQVVANVKGEGMDRLAKPIDRAGMAQVRRNLDIMEGAQDEDGWLPIGIANRPDLSMSVEPGVAERLSKPFAPSGDLQQSLKDYIGGRMADGDEPRDILADVHSADFFAKAGDPASYRAALDAVAPLNSDNHAWDALADDFVEKEYGNTRAPIQKQDFAVDQHSVDALHRALAETPEGVAAYKPVGDVTPKERMGLRKWYEASGKSWRDLVEESGSQVDAIHAVQDMVKSKINQKFAETHNTLKKDQPLIIGKGGKIGHVAEMKIAGMMSVVGQNFRPGKPAKLWNASMSGGKNFARQRLIKLLEANKRVVAAFGTGCVRGDTVLDDADNRGMTFAEWWLSGEQPDVIALSSTGESVRRKASAVFSKGIANCRRIELENGRSLVVSDDHLFLTRRGWVRAADVQPGDACARPASISQDVCHLPVDGDVNDQNYLQTASDSLLNCSRDSCLYDEQFHHSLNNDQAFSPSLVDVVGRNQQLHSDDLELLQEHTQNHELKCRLATPEHSRRIPQVGLALYPRPAYEGVLESLRGLLQESWLFDGRFAVLRHKVEQSLLIVEQSLSERTWSESAQFQTEPNNSEQNQSKSAILEPSQLCFEDADKQELQLHSNILVAAPCEFISVVNVGVAGQHIIFDLNVPVDSNYLACGVIHHNSGKSLLQLAGFTHLHGKGKVRKGVILCPSIVQAQFGGEAVRYLEAGKYKIHAEPGATRDERLAAYRDPNTHIVVATHQSFRDDMLHLGAKHAGISEKEMNDRLQKMSPEQRSSWAKSVGESEGFNIDYMSVDESQFTLNREGKENSGLANVADSFSDNAEFFLPSSGDIVKNDASEAFDLLSNMDRKRYTDRAAFMRKYGGDTVAAKDALKREMARYVYASRIDPDVKADRQTVNVKLNDKQNEALAQLDKDVSEVRIAKMNGTLALDAMKRLSPERFEGVPDDKVEDVARALQKSIGLIKNAATKRIIQNHPEGALLDMAASYANARRDKPGVIFAHSLESVEQLKNRLEKEGHRVVTLTGADSTQDKDKKKLEFNPETGEASADIIIASDAGATGMNLQRGQWEIQMDTPDTSMVHAQRQGRINRTGQKNDIELADLVADHPSVAKARDRLKRKYGLRELMTSTMEGLDDTGLAWILRQKFAESSNA